MTHPDYRALALEMADELDHNRRCLMDDRTLTHPLADRARQAVFITNDIKGALALDEDLIFSLFQSRCFHDKSP